MVLEISARETWQGKNQTLLQGFEWYSPGWTTLLSAQSDTEVIKDVVQCHWETLRLSLPQLKLFGITAIWIPPACKATGPDDNGYGIYDLYDLGEFDCKGGIGTKWGNKEALVKLCEAAQALDIAIIFDAVLNHKAAADGTENARAVRVDSKDRTKVLDNKSKSIECWTKFNFEARGAKYSPMKYNKSHFSGVDWDAATREKAIYRLVGQRPNGSAKDWATDVDCTENGNYDYLMFSDLDYSHPEVISDVKQWGTWLTEQLPGLRGIRLDAVKHYSSTFQRDFVQHIRKQSNRNSGDFFFVGEYWRDNARLLQTYLRNQDRSVTLFDVPLLYKLHNISTGATRDLSKVFQNTLVEIEPHRAVTFVTNHDTQRGQSLAAPIESWFIPHAYALILLRKAGLPCVFWGDIFGTDGPHAQHPACGGRLVRLLQARQYFAYGDQVDQDSFRTSAETRLSIRSRKRKAVMSWFRRFHDAQRGRTVVMVVVLSISWSWEQQSVHIGSQFSGQIFTDLMGWSWSGVQINARGVGIFPVGPRSISIWTYKDLEERSEIDQLIFPCSTVSDTEASP